MRKVAIAVCAVVAVLGALIWSLMTYSTASDPLLRVPLANGLVVAVAVSIAAGLATGLWRRRTRDGLGIGFAVALFSVGGLGGARLVSGQACDRLKLLEDECAAGNCEAYEAYRDEFYADVCRADRSLCRHSVHGSFEFTRAHVTHHLSCEVGLRELCNENESSCSDGRYRQCEGGQWGEGTPCPTGKCSNVQRGLCEVVF